MAYRHEHKHYQTEYDILLLVVHSQLISGIQYICFQIELDGSLVLSKFSVNQNTYVNYPDSNFRVAHMGPTWDRQDPGGSHVGHMNLAIRMGFDHELLILYS